MDKTLLFIFLVIFPFGQLLGHWPIDITVGTIFLYSLFSRKERTKAFNIFGRFIFVAVFSYLFSFFIFKTPFLITGGLYLFRLIIYWFFLDFCINLVRRNPQIKPIIFKSLIAISVAIAVFGWIQYFVYPDLTALKYIGWDDHLYRLVGTFLDPGYTSLFIVLGIILSFYSSNLIPPFLIISLAFTYSRAGYLAFLGAMLLMAFFTKKIKRTVIFIILFVIIVVSLPKPAGEGVNLARTFSVSLRLQNYTDTINIAKKSPLFGIGFNNICLAKNIYLGKNESGSHSCSGSDSSLLLIFATSGVIGLITFIDSIRNLLKSVKHGYYFNILVVSLLALFVHSLFTNSLFYPFTMGFFALLISLQTFKENS